LSGPDTRGKVVSPLNFDHVKIEEAAVTMLKWFAWDKGHGWDNDLAH